jgi:D-galactose 1-dehydrogenase
MKIAIIGLGKIARDQHVPALAASADFELAAVASPHDALPGISSHASLEALLESGQDIDAVAICTMPQARIGLARRALERGLHVLLEKPPGVNVREVQALADFAARRRRTLFASWHSRHAVAVSAAATWLFQRRVHAATVRWLEDVRVWHPGQTWLWEDGGLGVFDPGINALSILTSILPETLLVEQASLAFPGNCRTPIAARLRLAGSRGMAVAVELDFLKPGQPTWTIEVDTDDGRLVLSQGGAALAIAGKSMELPPNREYPALYAHFARLIGERRSDVDLAPLQLVEEALRCGDRIEAPDFIE